MAQQSTTELHRQAREVQLRGSPREEFPAFPFQPYEIQRHLMRAVYEILSAGGAGIVESPTGTGKTLSLICSVMQWLEDEHRRQMVEAGMSPEASGIPAKGSARVTSARASRADPTNAAASGSSSGHRREATSVEERVSSAREPLSSERGGARQSAGSWPALDAGGSRRHANMQDGAAWLRSHCAQGVEGDRPSREPSWVAAHREKLAQEAVKEVCVRRERRLKARAEACESAATLRAKEPVLWSLAGAERRRRAPGPPAAEPQEAGSAFLVEDWDSGDEGTKGSRPPSAWRRKSGKGAGNRDRDDDDDRPTPEGNAPEQEPLKIFFCSRTHSQLSQFVSELRRTPFAKHLQTITLGSRKNLCINDDVRKLGSAGAINERCLELQKTASERKAPKTAGGTGAGQAAKGPGKGSGGSCPFRRGPGEHAPEQFLTQLRASPPADIEDLVHLGQRLGYCPYYGARAALPEADVVVLPYQAVLHRSTREALGIDLEGCVVVFDEAHNLVDTVTGIYSSTLTLHQAGMVKSQLSGYLTCFRLKLNPGNRRYIQQLLVIACALHERLAREDLRDGSMSTETFLFSLGFDNINLFKLETYLAASNVVNKVSSYGDAALEADARSAQGAGDASPHSHLSAFRAFSDFLTALTSTDTDGRVLTYAGTQGPLDPAAPRSEGQLRSNSHGARASGKAMQADAGEAELRSAGKHAGSVPGASRGGIGPHFKYVMLNAAKHFEEVTRAARAVVLAGGTLRPMRELQLRLFPSLPPQDVRTFSCGHIVPRENVLPMVVPSGPSGARFQFSFKARSDPRVMDELGQLLLNVCHVVPEGIVVFFPSAAYLNQVVARWEASGKLKAIESRKVVLREPGSASQVESTLQSYREAVQGTPPARARGATGAPQPGGGALQGAPASKQPHVAAAPAPLPPAIARRGAPASASGAMLLCVVGGRLSEGINFSDGLGRCVVMVGLPFPNPRDPELMEQVSFASAAESAPAPAPAGVGGEVGASATEKQLLDAELAGEGARRAVSGGERYYTNLCTKAVNQSIGRAIRHKDDYAAILLVDTRYANQDFAQNLPGWILDSPLVYASSYPQVHGRLLKFFKAHRTQGQQALSS